MSLRNRAVAGSGPLTWLLLDPLPLPAWAHVVGVDADGGVWAPADIFGLAWLCATYDGEPVRFRDGHAYVRLSWVVKELPEHTEAAELFAERIRAAVLAGGAA